MSTVTPLDPESPEGIAAAKRLTGVLGSIQLAVWRRQNTGLPRPAAAATAPPSRPERRLAA